MLRGATARWAQRFFFAAGFLILGYCGAAWMDSRLRQAQGNRELDRILVRRSDALVPRIVVPYGGLIGRVEIPRLRLSDVVFQGTDSTTLGRGVGHVESTALPGRTGNVVLAAHRDSFFRDLRDIRKGDVVTVTTVAGSRTYRVDSTEVVKPTEISVLKPTTQPTLTLITCYPFHYIGHAPKRFIVRALDAQTDAWGQGLGPAAGLSPGAGQP